MTPMLMRSLAPITRPLVLLLVLAASAVVAAVRVRPVAPTDFRKSRRSKSFVDMRTPYSDGQTLTVDTGRASQEIPYHLIKLFSPLNASGKAPEAVISDPMV